MLQWFLLSAALSPGKHTCELHPGELLGSGRCYRNVKSKTVSECCDECKKDKRCAAFNWEPHRAKGICYLQSDSYNARPSPHNGTISGLSNNPPSPGPSPNPPLSAAEVTISGQVYWHTDPRFKSWNIDASPNRGWEVRNLSQPKLHRMAAASLPGFLRFGGSGNDGLTYGVGNITKCPTDAAHCFNETHFHDFMVCWRKLERAKVARHRLELLAIACFCIKEFLYICLPISAMSILSGTCYAHRLSRASYVTRVQEFSQASGAKLIFGLNINPRDPTTKTWCAIIFSDFYLDTLYLCIYIYIY